MYQLFIANKNYSSWSLRVWLLMKEMRIPFEEKMITFEGGDSWKKFSSFSPSGKLPCLKDNNLLIWDSLSITEYLAEKISLIWPMNRSARAWARSISAEMHSNFEFFNSKSLSCATEVNTPVIPDNLSEALTRIDDLVQEGLGNFGGPFLAGEKFTAADAFYSPTIIKINNYNLSVSTETNQYFNKILALPNLKEWIDQAIQEPWKVSEYEKMEKDIGKIIRDKRGQG
ncbi:glutathione S-transferase N-terminal domain-containing protein [Microbulbifer sp. PSTR4-B]|uniref:glutathione S-transferase N-terminal domain-containing protein n=1 Tax=Microbulbifer sp. PSTR4-B TaxID=3243396 RepID=UPI004039E68D